MGFDVMWIERGEESKSDVFLVWDFEEIEFED